MKVYTGTDIVQVSRIKNAIMTSKESFLDKVYTKRNRITAIQKGTYV